MAGAAWNIPMRVPMQRGIFIRIFVVTPQERVGWGRGASGLASLFLCFEAKPPPIEHISF